MAAKKQPEKLPQPPQPPQPVERRAIWPDPKKMHFDPDSPDKYNAALRISGDKKRRRTD